MPCPSWLDESGTPNTFEEICDLGEIPSPVVSGLRARAAPCAARTERRAALPVARRPTARMAARMREVAQMSDEDEAVRVWKEIETPSREAMRNLEVTQERLAALRGFLASIPQPPRIDLEVEIPDDALPWIGPYLSDAIVPLLEDLCAREPDPISVEEVLDQVEDAEGPGMIFGV